MDAEKEIAEISKLYSAAEDATKNVEDLHADGIVIPAINELRYAGYHILNALTSENDEDKRSEFSKAKKHCIRASYDAIEVGLLSCLAKYKIFREEYKFEVISSVVPDYLDIQSLVGNIKKFMEKADKSQREKYFSELKSLYDKLNPAIDKLEYARDQLNNAMNARRKKFYLTIITIILGVIAATFALLRYIDNDSTTSNYEVCMKAYSKNNSSKSNLETAVKFCDSLVKKKVN
ncbi:MAG: hypothetical protein OEZ39_02130 [Gammaproteobacteria bacterium]|nr:hypothetical protein [Gammaproteobacteria bacterium]MDH5650652.1 hypothetical protein [Gammaproteobacteria bacterium]